MQRKELDDADPFELVGVRLPVSDGGHVQTMAEVFIEEFLRMGWQDETILSLFRDPFYQGPFAAYRVLGEDELRRIISRVKDRLGGEK